MNQKIRSAAIVLLVSLSALVTGCASTKTDSQREYAPILVAPNVPDYKLEITLAKLSEILSTMELTPEQSARFHYDRGVIYDRLGLRILSRFDFHQAIQQQPKLADAYNFLGIYYTQEGEFESAYEAFDAVLELSPNYDYAFLNRGISLYYGQRYGLSVIDMKDFYKRDPSDGYRALWLYLAQSKLDKTTAKVDLNAHRKVLDDSAWSSVLIDYYLGNKNKQDVFELAKENLKSQKEYVERLCEAYFYMGKVAQQQGLNEEAMNDFKLVLATNIYDFVEHRYARLELAETQALIEAQRKTPVK